MNSGVKKRVMAKKRIHVTVGDSSQAGENMSRSVQKSEERVGTYTVKVPEGEGKEKNEKEVCRYAIANGYGICISRKYSL